ncbi:hypothetical protein L1D16_15455 [Vibrio sp. Isolate31]|uniref:hypothetical protein n=1 Tax=unclassified Vibrio TaxID=2614977 RepID=UPI001EFE6D4E|nr:MULTISPECIES: hypothetical protein [unclassified Vibrio]MCG9553564.1 hypothetical protein [Vibrio sp. Isolate32]MCG9602211.1 hypothetical protein [Vibrio sp. Isolate31]
MKMAVLEYKVCGIGEWVKTRISSRCAYLLAAEYELMGWPIKIDGEVFSAENA